MAEPDAPLLADEELTEVDDTAPRTGASKAPPPVPQRAAAAVQITQPVAPKGPVPPPRNTQEWTQLATALATGAQSAAAPRHQAILHFAAGRVYELRLEMPREAVTHYQLAYQADATYFAPLAAARRLMASLGNTEMAAQLLEMEIGATAGPVQAMRRRQKLRPALAPSERPLDVLRQLDDAERGLEPPRLQSLPEREALARAGDAWDRLAEDYQMAARATRDDRLRQALLAEAADILETHLEAKDEARELYRSVFDEDPGNVIARRGLKRIGWQKEDYQELADIYFREAQVTAAPSRAAFLLYTSALIHRRYLGDNRRCLTLLRAALEHTPGDRLLLFEIARACELLDDAEELAAAYRAMIEVSVDVHERTDLLFKLGVLFDSRLNQPEAAALVYRDVIKLSPAHLTARQNLGRLFARTGRFAELAALMEEEQAAEPGQDQKLAIQFKLAQLYEDRLGQPEDALRWYRQVLGIDPVYGPALRAVAKLLTSMRRWPDLVALHESELVAKAGDPAEHEQCVFLLDRIAAIHDEKIGDAAKAIEAYQRLLALAPKHLPALRALARLFGAAERWEDLITLHEQELEATERPEQRMRLLQSIGQIWEEKIGDLEHAVQAYKQALEIQPSYLPVLQALGRIYQREQRWEELVAMHERELAVAATDAQRLAILERMASVYEDRLAQDTAALEAYQRALTIDPKNLPAIRAMVRLHRKHHDWKALVTAVLREAECLEDPGARALAYHMAGELYETRTGDLEAAIEAYKKAIASKAEFTAASQSLTRIYESQGDYEAILKLLETLMATAPSGPEQVALLQHICRIKTEHLRDLEGASQSLAAIAEFIPDDLIVYRQLLALAEATGSRKGTTVAARRIAELIQDPEISAGYFLLAARVRRDRLGDASGALADELAAFARAPGDMETLDRLEDVYRTARSIPGLAPILEQQAGHAQGVDRIPLLNELLEICVEDLRDADHAAVLAQEVLKLAAGDAMALGISALMAMVRIHGAREDWPALRDTLRVFAQAASDPALKQWALTKLGLLERTQFNNEAGALEALTSLFKVDPLDAGAFEELAAVLRAGKHWARLAGAHELRAAQWPEPAKAVDDFVAAARLYENELNNPDAAITAYLSALRASPDDLRALPALADLHFATEHFTDAIGAYGRVLAVSRDPEQLKTAHLRQGVIYQDRAPNPAKAAFHLQEVLKFDPRHTGALERLAALAQDAKNWVAAKNFLLARNEVEPDPKARIQRHLAIAQMLEGAGDIQGAAEQYNAALTIDPVDRDAVSAYAALFTRLNDRANLTALYRAVLARIPPARAMESIPYRLELGDLLLYTFQQVPPALSEYQEVLRLDAQNLTALDRVAGIQALAPHTLGEALAARRALLAIDPLHEASHVAMFHLFQQLKLNDAAYCAAMLLRALKIPNNEAEFCYGEAKASLPHMKPQALGDADFEGLILPPAARGAVREIIAMAGEDLGKVVVPALDQYRVTKNHKARADHTIKRAFDRASGVLGAANYDLYLSESYAGIAVENTETMSVIVPAFANDLRPGEQLFCAAYALAKVRDRSGIITRLSPDRLREMVLAIAHAVEPGFRPAGPGFGSITELSKRIDAKLSKKARKALGEPIAKLIGTYEQIDWTGAFWGAELAAVRAGTVLAADLEAALNIVLKRKNLGNAADFENAAELRGHLAGDPALADFIQFACSDAHFRARKLIGLALQ